jgi:hypothetical protein
MKHRFFIWLILCEILLLAGFYVSGIVNTWLRQEEINLKRKVVRKLMLTDLAVWTEARYTRHPSQADLFTSFQDFPSSIEHFPAGSIIAPGNIKGKTRLVFKDKNG